MTNTLLGLSKVELMNEYSLNIDSRIQMLGSELGEFKSQSPNHDEEGMVA